MKKIPEIRFPEFSGEWVEKRLGEIGKIEMCKRIFKHQTNSKNGIPFYKISTFGKKADAFIDKDLFEEYKNKYPYPKKGDILISTSGSIGKIVIFDGEDSYYQDSNIVWINNPETQILNKLLKFIYEKISWEKYIENTTISRLYNDNLKKIKIYIPPTLAEQKKIAEFLSSVDEKIEVVSKKIEELKKYKKGLLQKLLNVNDKGEPELRFKGFRGKWIEKRLGELVEKAKSGGTPKSTVKKYYDGNIPFLSINDMTQQGKYLTKTTKTISDDGLKNSSAWIVPVNSIIYSMYASVGFVSINKIPVATSQAVINLVIKDKYNTEYIYYYLLWFKKYIYKYIETGTQGNLNAQIVKNLKIHLPPTLAEQEKIASFLSSIDEKIELNEKRLKALKSYKQGLLQKMFI